MGVREKLKFVFLDNVLYVKYDRKRYQKYCILNDDGSLPEKQILNKKALVKKIIIDKSVKKFKPKNVSNWFSDCFRALSISGLENLNSCEIETAKKMFWNCYKLKELDFYDSEFKNCKNFDFFAGNCEELTLFWGININFPHNVITPFLNCRKLNNFKGTRSVKYHLPLYDKKTNYVYEGIDCWGNKVTKSGKTVNEVFGEYIITKKSKKLLLLEEEINKFLQTGDSDNVEILFTKIEIEAFDCGLKARFNRQAGLLEYDLLINFNTDNNKRVYKVPKRKSWYKKICLKRGR